MLILAHIPALLFPPRARYDHIVQILRIRFDYEVLIAQVTLHLELHYWRGEVHAHFGLLSVVANAHGDVSLAAVAPNVVGHFKANDQNALVELTGSFAQCMRAVVSIQRAVLFRIEVGRIVVVLAFSLTLFLFFILFY